MLTKHQKEILKAIQGGIPLTPTPYADLAASLGIEEDQLIKVIRELLSQKRVSRFAASVAHRKVGITSNVMCCWRVPPERVDEVGKLMARFTEVTHCYERPTLPEWPYNVYTMIHGYNDEECEAVIRSIAEGTGISEYVMVYSTQEFKKIGARIWDA